MENSIFAVQALAFFAAIDACLLTAAVRFTTISITTTGANICPTHVILLQSPTPFTTLSRSNSTSLLFRIIPRQIFTIDAATLSSAMVSSLPTTAILLQTLRFRATAVLPCTTQLLPLALFIAGLGVEG